MDKTIVNRTTIWERAQEIIDKNMLGIEDVTKHLKITFSREQLVQLGEVPFTEAVLQECKDTHILFPGYPLTILEIRDKVSRELFYSHEDVWYNNQGFAKKKKLQCRWYLIRKNEVPNSFRKTFGKQKELLRKDEKVPYACEVVFMAISYKLVTGKYLFSNYYVRCQNLDSDGHRVGVGYFASDGLNVSSWSDGDRYCGLGLAASRKFQKIDS